MVTGFSNLMCHISAGHAKSYNSKKLFIQILGTTASFTLTTVNTVDILKVELLQEHFFRDFTRNPSPDNKSQVPSDSGVRRYYP